MKDINNETLDIEGTAQYNGGLPSFLNVLTILTFVGSGLALLSGIYGLTSIDKQRESLEMMRNMPDTNAIFGEAFSADMIKLLELSLENVYLLQGSAILIAILCIIGAILMRRLKKNGYFLYMLATVASIVIPITVFGMGLMGGIMITGQLFTIAFVVMYTVNFKYLK